MQIDLALQQILPYLQNITQPTLWYADESAGTAIDSIQAEEQLTLVTNRYDIYQHALSKKINAIFSDFIPKDYPTKKFSTIVYRISKEKALVNHLVNQAAYLLNETGRLVISGYKQEGIKSYGDNIQKKLGAHGKLIKSGAVYTGEFRSISKENHLNDKNYPNVQKIPNISFPKGYFYSKPGVFGWNKIDKGTDLLLTSVKRLFSDNSSINKSLLDLGCGYGCIFLNMDEYKFASIVATDNNASAITCAIKNTELIETIVTVSASDCANTINEKFDFILCNPPFHQGFKHSQSLTKKFIDACKKKLNASGKAVFVLNEFVAIDGLIAQAQLKQHLVLKQSGFKVILIEHK